MARGKKPPGRPRVYEEREKLTIYFSRKESEAIQAAAARAMIPASRLVRAVVLKELKIAEVLP